MLSILRPRLAQPHTPFRLLFSAKNHSSHYRKMGKNKSKPSTPSESFLQLSNHASTTPIVDTHTHLASTFDMYNSRYNKNSPAKYQTVYDFVKDLYAEKRVEAVVDVWCEAPVRKLWKQYADSALSEEDRKTKWGGMEYWFVMGWLSSNFSMIRSNIDYTRCSSVSTCCKSVNNT